MVKQIETKCKEDPTYRQTAFPNSLTGADESTQAEHKKKIWNEAVRIVPRQLQLKKFLLV